MRNSDTILLALLFSVVTFVACAMIFAMKMLAAAMSFLMVAVS